MFKKKCPSCDKKIEKKFAYCPFCGASLRTIKERENYGLLGRHDSREMVREPARLPFGMEKVVNSLMKQLEKQMNENGFDGAGMPKGIKIKISPAGPQVRQVIREKPKIVRKNEEVSPEESERRAKLPKVNAESKVKRIADTIIYEIETPGVKSGKDVVITELASGLEVRAYSKDKCYIKTIPLKVEVIRHYLEKDKLVVELKG